ncbi:MAG: TonB-dependent receptor [Acidobacteria bacterium]|nr:TonB-dependent receptor [Acidobacteriota bacterium]
MTRQGALALALLLAMTGVASAQTVSATTGAINGRVTDNTGAVLPGARVVATSAALMGTREAVTNEEGNYRFPAVPPGDYTLTFELDGFITVRREGIRVGLGFTATVNIEMRIAGLEESLTVTGESPVVDTQATKITTSFDTQMLASLPNARDQWAILAESPAVRLSRIDVGGSASGTQTGFSVYGTSGQNRPMVEGINSTEGTGAFGNYVDYGSYDEVAVATGAHGADMAVPGVQMQFISKSGGNAYHGSFFADYENEDWQAFNIDAAQIARGVTGGGGLEPRDVNRLFSYYDINIDGGGFMIKDRLWWYASLRYLNTQARYTNFPVKPHQTILSNFTAKLTYSLSQNNKFVAYLQPSRKQQPNRLDRFRLNATTAFHTSTDSTFYQDYYPRLWKVEYSSVLSDTLFFEIRTGMFGYNWPDKNYTDAPSVEDIGRNEVSGAARNRFSRPRRNQVLGSLSYFKDNWAGSHNLKFGWEIFRETGTVLDLAGSYNNVVHILRNGAPIEVYLLENPTKSENGLWAYGVYLNDSWRVSNRWSLNLGARFDRYRNFLPEQEHPVGRFNPVAQIFPEIENTNTFNTFGPRFGMTYNLSGNGKTVAKFNIGRYWWNPGTGLSSNPNPNVWWKRYAWTDPNRNGVWDPGEEGRLLATAGGVETSTLDPDLKDPYTNEIAAWFERELVPNFGVRTGVVWRGVRQQHAVVNINQPFEAFTIPALVPDPGPDGRIGTSDDRAPVQAWNLNPALLGLRTVTVRKNIPNSDENFYTWEITGTKRMSHRWSLLASFSHTWNRPNVVPLNPNDLQQTDGKGTHKFTDWAAKLHGTWEAPWGLKITPILRHQSGATFGRTFTATLNYGSVTMRPEARNARRNDNVTLVDARVEKVVRLRRTAQVSGFIDLFNMFNANPIQNITSTSGSNFLRPSNIVPPRLLRIGTKVDW